jgi:hypothetical protein
MQANQYIEKLGPVLRGNLAEICRLAANTLAKLQHAQCSICRGRTIAMLKHIFDAIEAVFRAVILLLVLLIGVAALVLGAFISGLLFFRIGELLWRLILRESWV